MQYLKDNNVNPNIVAQVDTAVGNPKINGILKNYNIPARMQVVGGGKKTKKNRKNKNTKKQKGGFRYSSNSKRRSLSSSKRSATSRHISA
jgi:hypothetical protein